MPEPRIAQRKVTFHDGRPLPLGTHATFKDEDELWIAMPLTKYVGFLTIVDNNIGVLNRIRDDATRWLSSNPGDVARIGMILAVIATADEHSRCAAIEKSVVNAL